MISADISKPFPQGVAVDYRDQCCEDELDKAVLGQLTSYRRREPTIAAVSDTKAFQKPLSPLRLQWL